MRALDGLWQVLAGLSFRRSAIGASSGNPRRSRRHPCRKSVRQNIWSDRPVASTLLPPIMRMRPSERKGLRTVVGYPWLSGGIQVTRIYLSGAPDNAMINMELLSGPTLQPYRFISESQ